MVLPVGTGGMINKDTMVMASQNTDKILYKVNFNTQAYLYELHIWNRCGTGSVFALFIETLQG